MVKSIFNLKTVEDIDSTRLELLDMSWSEFSDLLMHTEADKQSERGNFRRSVNLNNLSEIDKVFMEKLEQGLLQGHEHEVSQFLKEYFELCFVKEAYISDQVHPFLCEKGGVVWHENGRFISLEQEALNTYHFGVKNIRNTFRIILNYACRYYGDLSAKQWCGVLDAKETGVYWDIKCPEKLSITGKTLMFVRADLLIKLFNDWNDTGFIDKHFMKSISKEEGWLCFRVYGNTMIVYRMSRIELTRSERRNIRRFSSGLGLYPGAHASLKKPPSKDHIKRKAREFFRENSEYLLSSYTLDFNEVLCRSYVEEVAYQSEHLSDKIMSIFYGAHDTPVVFEGRGTWLRDLTIEKQGGLFVYQTDYRFKACYIDEIQQSIKAIIDFTKENFDVERILINYVHDDYFSYTSHPGYDDVRRMELLVDESDIQLNHQNILEVKSHFREMYRRSCRKEGKMSEEAFIDLMMSDYIFSVVVILKEEVNIEKINDRSIKLTEKCDYQLDLMLPGYGVYQSYDRGWYGDTGNMNQFIPRT